MLALLLLFAEPFYTADGVVNAATNRPGPIAPNSIVSIYGREFSQATRAVGPADLQNNMLPTALGATGVRVHINSVPARMYYVSPTQLNLLVPASLREGITELRVTVDGRAGAAVKLPIARVSPGLFQLSSDLVIASRPDGSIYTREAPARPGEIVVLYATGLGDFEHDFLDGELAGRASRIRDWQMFLVEIDGVKAESVHYVGTAPGFVGLYQINLRVPEYTRDFPEIRIGFDGIMSPPGVVLPIRRPNE